MQYIDIIERQIAEQEALNEANALKNVAAGLGAAALLTGASMGAHALGKHHGEQRQQEWTQSGDPHQWQQGDWFGELSPEDQAAMAPPKQERRPFSFLSRKPARQALVAPTAASSEDVTYLAATMWGEARSEGETGMRAVGHVIMNRVGMNRAKWGDTVRKVVRSDKQFSCWNQGDPNLKKIKRMMELDRYIASRPDDLDDWMTSFRRTSEYKEYTTWRRAKKLARTIANGEERDITGGADHYHTTAVNPFWVPSMTKIGKIGNHLFYTSKRRVAESADVHEMTCSCCFGHEEMIDEDASKNMNYDLQKKYDEFNTKYFESKLPRIPLKWGALRGKTGVVKFKVTPGPGHEGRQRGRGVRRDYSGYVLVPNSMTLTMSTANLMAESKIDTILIHEMIHVWMAAVEGRLEEQHGQHFERMRKALSQRVGVEIPLTDDSSNDIVNPDNKVKELLVMLWTKPTGEYSYAVMNMKSTFTNETFPDLVVDWARRAKHFKANAKFYIVKDPAWSGLLFSGVKEQRKKITGMNKMSPERQEALLAALEKATLLADVPPK